MKKSIRGIVKKHKGLGKKLGYPTANIEIDADAEEGVFAGYTRISSPLPNPPHQGEGKKRKIPPQERRSESPFLPLEGGGEVGVKLPSIIFIGAPEMFGDRDKRLETHILDFGGELHGKEIEVEIVRKLRSSRKFDSAAALLEQMKVDEKQAREYFKHK